MRFFAFFAWILKHSNVAKITGVSRPAINRVYADIRQRISEECERLSPFKEGEIEVDESYFGARRVRGAKGKTPVFGMLKRGGKVYTQVIKTALYPL